ncbi:alpha/beta-hydrolase [Rhizoclosmatium globosum]|uniref:Alpha/beta-hydrolase n=1 Tax=Rhizoclosmatium globosum TaxID=329046 RepID=A0A1Y2CSU5_9FUNG|nr:alpha/beta-hydrolase [Rhizoclosmatium globosum]|eukprot:ORY50081.1 alpha/beta-hydrolase [Rhizoclosmatium globosum]
MSTPLRHTVFRSPSQQPRRAKPPVLLLHGFLGRSEQWRRLGPSFATTFGADVLAPDLRNHGASPHTNVHTLDLVASDVAALASRHLVEANSNEDSKPGSNFALIGHSHGGKTAMHLALSMPTRVHRLVVVDTTPATYSLGAFKSYFAAMNKIQGSRVQSYSEADGIMQETVKDRDVRRFLLANLVHATNDKKHMHFCVNLPVLEKALTHPDPFLSTAGFPFHPPSATYDKPCLFIRGTRSDFIKGDREALVRQRFPNAEIVDVETGHWVHHEKPREFMDIVVKWWKDMDERGV